MMRLHATLLPLRSWASLLKMYIHIPLYEVFRNSIVVLYLHSYKKITEVKRPFFFNSICFPYEELMRSKKK